MQEGQVLEVIQRGHDTFVGKIESVQNYAFLVVDNRLLNNDIFIPAENLKGAKNGDKAIVKIIEWSERDRNPVGEVVEVLGATGDNDAEMNAILVEFGLPYSYPKHIESLADEIPEDIPAEEIEKRRIESYGRTIDFSIARQMVNKLDFLFQASAYRDSLLNGSDTEVVIKRQFLKKHPQYSENGEICGWISGSTLYNITHNGISLDEDGAEWSVQASSRYLPEGVKGEWNVSRKDGVYTLSGSMIHMEPDVGYFDTDLNVQFTTGRTVVLVHFDHIIEPKTTLRYCFDGEINATIDNYYPDQLDTKINLKLDGLSGYDVKTYHDGIPFFGPEVIYFKSGVVTASVTGEQPPLHFVVNFTPHGIMFPEI
jgi:hypothetical protein